MQTGEKTKNKQKNKQKKKKQKKNSGSLLSAFLLKVVL